MHLKCHFGPIKSIGGFFVLKLMKIRNGLCGLHLVSFNIHLSPVPNVHNVLILSYSHWSFCLYTSCVLQFISKFFMRNINICQLEPIF